MDVKYRHEIELSGAQITYIVREALDRALRNVSIRYEVRYSQLSSLSPIKKERTLRKMRNIHYNLGKTPERVVADLVGDILEGKVTWTT